MSIENRPMEEQISRDETETESCIEDREESGCLLDVLHLHMLQLMEDRISQQLALKAHTSRALLDLARTRLQQGAHHMAAAARLPGSSSTPYRALCRLLVQATTWGSYLKLNVEPARGYLRPVAQIFGALVPSSLRLATHKWERSVQQIVECVNVQRELQSVLESIERLKWTLHSRGNI